MADNMNQRRRLSVSFFYLTVANNLKVLNQFDFLLVSFQINFAKNLPSNMLARLRNFCMHFFNVKSSDKLLN